VPETGKLTNSTGIVNAPQVKATDRVIDNSLKGNPMRIL
jgi:hypothetical protein